MDHETGTDVWKHMIAQKTYPADRGSKAVHNFGKSLCGVGCRAVICLRRPLPDPVVWVRECVLDGVLSGVDTVLPDGG